MTCRISLKELKWFLIVFLFIDVKFSNLSFINVDRYLSILRMFILICIFVKNYKNMKINNFLIMVSIYYLSYIIPSIIYGSLDLRTFYLWVKEISFNVGILMILQKMMNENYIKTLKIIYYSFIFWIILHNILSLITNIEVLGIRTRYTDYFLPALILLLILHSIKIEKLSFINIVFLLTSFYFTITQWISTCILVTVLLIGYYLLYSNKIIKKICNKIINYNLLIFFAFGLNISILLFNIQNFFSYIIVDLLHEDLTLNSRTLIWQQTFERLKDHNIFLGAGIQQEGLKNIQTAIYDEYGHNLLTPRQAHNQLLSIFFFNGILGLISYIGIIYILGKKINILRNKKIKNLLIIGVFFICITMITELSADGISFLIFALCIYNIPYLNKFRR